MQIYGRGTRLDPENPNKDCLILDCANVVEDTVHPLMRVDFYKKKGDMDVKRQKMCPKCKRSLV